jgi:hypothetical protein
MTRAILALLAALWAAAAALADAGASGRFLERLAGNWRGAGEVRQMAADMRMAWEPVLDGAFMQLTMENLMSGGEGQSWHFKARALYRVQDDGSITGTWFDSRGISLPLSGTIEDDLMTIQWGNEATERGSSTYRLSADALEVTDLVLAKDGEWRAFGRTRLTRQ